MTNIRGTPSVEPPVGGWRYGSGWDYSCVVDPDFDDPFEFLAAGRFSGELPTLWEQASDNPVNMADRERWNAGRVKPNLYVPVWTKRRRQQERRRYNEKRERARVELQREQRIVESPAPPVTEAELFAGLDAVRERARHEVQALAMWSDFWESVAPGSRAVPNVPKHLRRPHAET